MESIERIETEDPELAAARTGGWRPPWRSGSATR
jgi:hypothetical protein